MSDIYIRVIPTDPHWQPTVEAAAGAKDYVVALSPGPAIMLKRSIRCSTRMSD